MFCAPYLCPTFTCQKASQKFGARRKYGAKQFMKSTPGLCLYKGQKLCYQAKIMETTLIVSRHFLKTDLGVNFIKPFAPCAGAKCAKNTILHHILFHKGKKNVFTPCAGAKCAENGLYALRPKFKQPQI